MIYKDLNLKKLREECGIDFAHYTYRKGQCTHCDLPSDMAKKYWHNGEVKNDNYTFILFANARDTVGSVNSSDTIHEIEYINWALTPDQLSKVCKELQNQMPEYTIFVPKNIGGAIIAVKTGAQVLGELVKLLTTSYIGVNNL